jgi:hypothetical protein
MSVCEEKGYHDMYGWLAHSQWYDGDFLGWRCWYCGYEEAARSRADVIHGEHWKLKLGRSVYAPEVEVK